MLFSCVLFANIEISCQPKLDSITIPQNLDIVATEEIHWTNRNCGLTGYFLKPHHCLQTTLLLILTTRCWTQKMNFLALKSNGEGTNQKSAKAYNRPNRLPSFAATPRVAVHYRRVEQNTTKYQEKHYKGEAEDQLFKSYIWRKHCKWFRFHDRGYLGILLVQTLSSHKLTLAKEFGTSKSETKKSAK